MAKYVEMIVSDPDPDGRYGLSRIRLWFLLIPIIVAVCVVIVPRLRKLPGSYTTIALTLPLVPTPFIVSNYMPRHFLCYGNPEVYSGFLERLTPILILAPVAGYVSHALWHKKCS